MNLIEGKLHLPLHNILVTEKKSPQNQTKGVLPNTDLFLISIMEKSAEDTIEPFLHIITTTKIERKLLPLKSFVW